MAEQNEKSRTTFRKTTHENSYVDFGKVPPQLRDVEDAVLGAIMIESGAFPMVEAFFNPAMFYVDANQRVAKAILELFRKKSPIDLLTVTEQLKVNGDLEMAGGPFYLAQLTNKIGSAANVEYHARLVFEKYVFRLLISHSQETIQESYEDSSDLFEVLNKAEHGFRDINNLFQSGNIITTQTFLERAEVQEKSGFIKSKHHMINAALGGGWGKGKLNIVAARPGMGKTAFLVSEMVNMVGNNYKVAAFLPEMTERQIATRLICNLTKIPNTRYVHKQFEGGEPAAVDHAKQWIIDHDWNMTLDFTAGILLNDLISKIRKLHREKGLDIVFIDYLQLINQLAIDIKGKSRDEAVGQITKALKNLAKEEDIAIVLFCALSRKVEDSNDKVPSLIHLRESGNIEQDADIVIFMLRPEYYFKKDAEGNIQYQGDDQLKFKDVCCFIGAKNRDGRPFESKEYCNLSVSEFDNLYKDDTPF